MIGRLALTLVIGLAGGLLFKRLRAPGGMMVGAMVVTAIVSVATADVVYMPAQARVLAQMVAGAFIATGMDKSDLLHMRHIPRPIGILVGSMLVLNLTMGMLVHLVCGVDLLTAFYSAVPGGVSNIPIIAAEVGANSGAVAMAQLARLIVGIGVFPAFISHVTKAESRTIVIEERQGAAQAPRTAATVLITLGVTAATGLLGNLSGVPAGTMLFALVGVLALKLILNRAWMPTTIRLGAQVLSGCYIGTTITRGELAGLRDFLLPILILLMGYAVACYTIGALLHRFAGMTRREGMLAAMPAGASDIALISADLGVTSPDLMVLQIVRMLSSVILFPQIINLLIRLIG